MPVDEVLAGFRYVAAISVRVQERIGTGRALRYFSVYLTQSLPLLGLSGE